MKFAQKSFTIKSMAFLIAVAVLVLPLFSCHDAKSFNDRALVQLRNAKNDCYTVINGGGFNNNYVTVSSMEDNLNALKKVPDNFLEKRAAAYAEKHPAPSSIQYQVEGQTQTLEFEKVRCIVPPIKEYCFENEYIWVDYNPETMDMTSFFHCIYKDGPVDEVIRRNKENNFKIVSTHNEAIEYAKVQLTDTYGINLDEYVVIDAYLSTPDSYIIKFEQIYREIHISIILVEVDMYYGITLLSAQADQSGVIDLYKACVDYATTEKAREQSVQKLIDDAKKDEQIVEIKNVQPLDCGFTGYIDEKGNQSHHYPTYGSITYIKEIDRLAVALYYSYTAVMKDGSEKQGANVVDVIIPIDWAEVYGDEYLLEEKPES